MDWLEDGCNLYKEVKEVQGLPSNSTSPSDTWILTLNDNTKVFMKYFIDPNTSDRKFKHAMYGNRHTLYHMRGLDYEIKVYNIIKNKLMDTNICDNFVRFYSAGLGCDYTALELCLEPRYRKNIQRNVQYMASMVQGRPSITADGYEIKNIVDATKLQYKFALNQPIPNGTLTLSDFMKTIKTISVFKEIWFQLVYACFAMFLEGIAHNDLHSGNVYIVKRDTPITVRYSFENDQGETIDNTFKSNFKVMIYDFDRAYSRELGDNPLISGQSGSTDCYFDACNDVVELKDLWRISWSLSRRYPTYYNFVVSTSTTPSSEFKYRMLHRKYDFADVDNYKVKNADIQFNSYRTMLEMIKNAMTQDISEPDKTFKIEPEPEVKQEIEVPSTDDSGGIFTSFYDMFFGAPPAAPPAYDNDIFSGGFEQANKIVKAQKQSLKIASDEVKYQEKTIKNIKNKEQEAIQSNKLVEAKRQQKRLRKTQNDLDEKQEIQLNTLQQVSNAQAIAIRKREQLQMEKDKERQRKLQERTERQRKLQERTERQRKLQEEEERQIRAQEEAERQRKAQEEAERQRKAQQRSERRARSQEQEATRLVYQTQSQLETIEDLGQKAIQAYQQCQFFFQTMVEYLKSPDTEGAAAEGAAHAGVAQLKIVEGLLQTAKGSETKIADFIKELKQGIDSGYELSAQSVLEAALSEMYNVSGKAHITMNKFIHIHEEIKRMIKQAEDIHTSHRQQQAAQQQAAQQEPVQPRYVNILEIPMEIESQDYFSTNSVNSDDYKYMSLDSP
jgi:hypothetical protein